MSCSYSTPTKVRLADGSFILAHTIASVEQLEEIKDILASAVEVAIDTEFTPQKTSNIPKLKVLQLAIGNQGFAFIIEKFEINVIHAALERVLTDPDVVRIAWSFVGDASVIQTALGITCGRTFDLQAKLRFAENGVIHNLRRAMQERCADWCGQELFDRLKGASNDYRFGKADCVWNMEPLPEEVIMYSIFDAVALLELRVRLSNIETLDEHFWPDYTSEEVRKKYRTAKKKHRKKRPSKKNRKECHDNCGDKKSVNENAENSLLPHPTLYGTPTLTLLVDRTLHFQITACITNFPLLVDPLILASCIIITAHAKDGKLKVLQLSLSTGHAVSLSNFRLRPDSMYEPVIHHTLTSLDLTTTRIRTLTPSPFSFRTGTLAGADLPPICLIHRSNWDQHPLREDSVVHAELKGLKMLEAEDSLEVVESERNGDDQNKSRC